MKDAKNVDHILTKILLARDLKAAFR